MNNLETLPQLTMMSAPKAWRIAVAFIVTGYFFASTVCTASKRPETLLCDQNILPAELRGRLKNDLPSWKIQDVSDLGPQAKGRWQSEKPLTCPGIAVGEFEKTTQPSYAVLLVPILKPDSAYRLLIFTPGKGKSPGILRKVDEWDKGGGANNFIHTLRIAKFFSREWINKLHLRTKDGLMFCDSGKDEYEVDVFFWSEGIYRSEPIDY